jgi:hypothetical protein
MSEPAGPKGDRGATGKRGRQGLPWSIRYAIVSLFALAFLLAAASSWLSVRTVRGEVANRASVTQLCQAGNESRAQQVTLWTHLVQISAPPQHETAAQKRQRQALTRQFIGYIRQVFAPRDCTGG